MILKQDNDNEVYISYDRININHKLEHGNKTLSNLSMWYKFTTFAFY